MLKLKIFTTVPIILSMCSIEPLFFHGHTGMLYERHMHGMERAPSVSSFQLDRYCHSLWSPFSIPLLPVMFLSQNILPFHGLTVHKGSVYLQIKSFTNVCQSC